MRLTLFVLIWKLSSIFVLALAMPNLFTRFQHQPPQILPAYDDISHYRPLQLPNQMTTTQIPAPLAPVMSANPFYQFNAKLFRQLTPSVGQTNFIYSPLSVQTVLSFLYTGAQNQTALELRQVLEISAMPGEVARQFQALLQQMQRQTNADLQLQMANKLYYSNDLRLNHEFHRNTLPYFQTEAERADFRAPEQAAYQINKWAAEQTNQRILNLIPPGVLDAQTKAILVNAIYLKAKWAKEFSTIDTQREDFQMGKNRSVPVDMMYTEDNFDYGELKALNAKAINLPFKNSDLAMLILLPDDVEGLGKLEAEFNKVELHSLMNALSTQTVILRLPKFRIDFDLDMSEPLKQLGIRRLFTPQAELPDFFKDQRVSIDKFQHKAYINVNEGGVEAAAATFAKLIPLSAPSKVNHFNADHPFMFIIHSSQAIFFIGHVINP